MTKEVPRTSVLRDEELIARLRERAAAEREIQANNEAVATALIGQRLLFEQGLHSAANSFAVRLGLQHENCAKNDARLAQDWDAAAYRIEALVKEKDQEYKDNIVRMAGQAKDFMEEISTLKARIEALSISNATLIAERDAAEDRAVRLGAAMETLRPVWAQGWSGESVAAQASATALAQLWQMLGASNQTEAVTALRATLAEIKSHSDEFATQKGESQ